MGSLPDTDCVLSCVQLIDLMRVALLCCDGCVGTVPCVLRLHSPEIRGPLQLLHALVLLGQNRLSAYSSSRSGGLPDIACWLSMNTSNPWLAVCPP